MIGVILCGLTGFYFYRDKKQSKKLEISSVPNIKIKTIAAEQSTLQMDVNNLQAARSPPNID
jgi:hypothetical protein